MPNWCNNFVEVGHSDPAKIKALADAFERGEFLNEVIPVPEDLKITAGYLGDGDAQKELERKTAENVEKYGYGNWYDYCVARWGTKWDVGGDGQSDIHPDGTLMTASFDSAWSPPMGVYQELVEQGYTVRAMYYEPGMAYAGVYDNGNDDYIELGGMSAKEVENTIDPDLDQMFGITEQMYEYEAENEEELTAWVKDGIEQNKKLGLIAE